MRTALLATIALAASVALPAHEQAPDAATLAAAIQKKYSAVTALTARFTQESRHEFRPQVERTAGTLRILKPNHLWFAYEGKFPAFVVIDGQYMWDYDVATKVATRLDLPKGDEMPPMFRFLAGSGNLVTDFAVALAADQPQGEWHLELRPKRPEQDFEAVTLMVRRSDYGLVGMRTVDEYTVRTFRFTNVNERARLAPADFKLKLPADVHIEYRRSR